MTRDFENLSKVKQIVNCSFGDEFCFTHTNAIKAVQICTENEVAVLGVEIYQVQGNDFQSQGCSEYDLGFKVHNWSLYVKDNNILAVQVLGKYLESDGFVYLLTTASEREFEILKMKSSELRKGAS